MKEQWTDDLRNKLEGYESPLLPDKLWDDIDKEISVKSIMKALLQGQKAIRRTFLLTMLALPFQKKTWKLHIH